MKKLIYLLLPLFLYSCVEDFPEPDFQIEENTPVTVKEKWTAPKPRTGLRLSFVEQTDEMVVVLYTNTKDIVLCTYDLKGNPINEFSVQSKDPIEYEYPEDVILLDDWIHITVWDYSMIANIHTGVFHEHVIDLNDQKNHTTFNYVLAEGNEAYYQERRADSSVWLMRWDLDEDVHTAISELHQYEYFNDLDEYKIIECAYFTPLHMSNLKQVFVSHREHDRGTGVNKFTTIGYPVTWDREGEKWELGSYYQASHYFPISISSDDNDFHEYYSIVITGWDFQRVMDYEKRQILWKTSFESKPDTRLKRDDFNMYTKTEKLTARNIRSGKTIWSKSVGDVINQLGMNDTYLAFVSFDSPDELFSHFNYLRILKKSNGAELYIDTDPLGSSNPVENNLDAGLNRVVSLNGNTLYCADGQKLMALEIEE